MAGRSSVAYEWSGVALLRASTDPGGLDLPADLDAPGEDGIARQAEWLSHVWRREEVRAALAVASPALGGQIEAIMSAEHHEHPQVRRVVLALASYLLRWQRRATPFGLFAGAGLARIGGPAQVRWGDQREVARADAGWLGDVLARLHDCPDLMERLTVVATDAGAMRGRRFASPGPVPDGPAQGLAPVEVSVRATRPVRVALETAREPVPFGKLSSQLTADFPAAAEEQVRVMLAGLVTQGMLVTSLRAPMTEPDALGHVCARLREVHADDIPDISSLVRELAAIHRILQTGGSFLRVPDQTVTGRMSALSQAADTPLAVDTILDCEVRIPEQAAREACDAASVLHRVSPYPSGHPAWTEYHARFLDRYGTGAHVPVLDLVADSGIGLPAGYLGSSRPGRTARPVTRRDATLLILVQRAMMSGDDEIILTDQVIGDLTDGEPTEPSVASRTEIAVEIRATSLEALDRGRFTLLVTGTPRPGSSMIGRHASLLNGRDRDLLAATFAAREPDSVPAQLSFAPRKRRNENVVRTRQLLPAVIPIGEHCHRPEGLIPLANLAVTADEHRFFLIRMSTGQLVEPRVTHALEAGVHTPPLARFLAEITTSRCAVYRGFDWGAAARLPYLPRVRYRRTILSPARWVLPAGELPGPRAAMAEWEEALRAWQSRWHVPAHTAVVGLDRRQPMDLQHPSHRLLLRTRLRRAGQVELREAAAPEDLGWIGRAHELVLPLEAAVPRRPRPGPRRIPAASASRASAAGQPAVLCARVHGHP